MTYDPLVLVDINGEFRFEHRVGVSSPVHPGSSIWIPDRNLRVAELSFNGEELLFSLFRDML